MNRQIRGAGVAIIVLFGLLFLNLNWIQLIHAQALADRPGNVRVILREYAIKRGAILSADGATIAQSEDTPTEKLKFLRTYPGGTLFAHVSGYYSIVFSRAGLEQSHNRDLTGSGGVLTMQELGDRLFGGRREGDTIFISIDSRVQKAASDALGSQKGAVVAIDPLSGQILAMTAFPSFDPNKISSHDSHLIRTEWSKLESDPDHPLLNRATSEAYPPGSTFKIVTAAAALESGMGIDTAFPPTSEFLPPQTDKPIHNFGNRSCGGDMTEAFRVSCNTYFARLAAELPQGEFEKVAGSFGFAEVPPLDLATRASKFPSARELRSPAFRAQSGIGQFNVAATPLQMALVVATVANRGNVPVPKLVKEVRDSSGDLTFQARAEIWKRAISPETAATLKQLMTNVVANGTGRSAQIPGVEVAGKTGTAQTGRDDPPHVWFVAFAPASSPRIAVAVIVENGGDLRDEATGGRVAAPIAKKVIETYRSVSGW